MNARHGSEVRSRARTAALRCWAAALARALSVLGCLAAGLGLAGSVAAGSVLEPSSARATLLTQGPEELTPVLPQTIHRGKPPGVATLRGVDWSRARRAELPAPQGLAVLWERRIAGGLSGDVLVDAAGFVFATGQGRVLQLGTDGREQYLRRAEFSSAVASALLADGQRVVLSREGTLAAWSARGDPTFGVELQVPAGWTRGALLPLPDGSVLVSAGAWLLLVSARGRVEGYTQLKEAVAETLLSAGQTWILTERGTVLSWDGRSPPLQRGNFDARVSTAAAGAPGQLLAVLDGRELAEWSLASGPRRGLAQLPGAGPSARLSLPSGARVQVLGTNGTLFSVTLDPISNAPAQPESQQLPAGAGELLGSDDGGVAWFVSNAPLTLRRGDGVTRSLSAVVCAEPSSLIPAGSGRLLAACRSGQLWLIGPAAPTNPDAADASPRAPPSSNP